ncbi:MAG: LCP family protein [Ruminococcus sp.]|nr:LCP family protein [Ruminococcus sp.]
MKRNDKTYRRGGKTVESRQSYYESVPAAKQSGKAKNVLVKTASVLCSLVIILLMILNMPIIAYNKNGKPTESISIITFIKRWQPLNVEGDLETPVQDFNVNSEIVHEDFSDGLDLPQTIEGQYSVLFLGFDEDGTRSDVNWIFQFDIAAAKINVLQIPRDTFMPTYTSNVTGKFNSIYGSGDVNKSAIQNVVNAVQENFCIPIDAYITTHCYDIVDMVDLVGGIPVNLDEQIMYEADKIIPAGESILNGQQAEWFVRYRHGFSEGDIGRVKNQRVFLAAAMEKLLNIYEEEGSLAFYGYLKEIYDNEYIHTDLSVENISMLADFASTVAMENVQVNMVPGEGADFYAADGQAYSVWSVHKQATIDMLNEYYRPYQHDLILEESALEELITDYRTTNNDNTMDTLEDLKNGAEPGQAKTEAAEAVSEEEDDYSSSESY